jgi:hypothetical protein
MATGTAIARTAVGAAVYLLPLQVGTLGPTFLLTAIAGFLTITANLVVFALVAGA